MPIQTPRLSIRPVMPGDGGMINEMVIETLELFQKWFPWAQKVPTVQESEITARKFYADFILRKDFNFLIAHQDRLIRACSRMVLIGLFRQLL